LDEIQEYRRNWTGLWTKCRNTDETGQVFGQNAGYGIKWTGLWTKCRIRNKMDRTLDKMQDTE